MILNKLLGKFGYLKNKNIRLEQDRKESLEESELKDRLIQEHMSANAAAREHLIREAPKVASRYVNAMNRAMLILKEN